MKKSILYAVIALFNCTYSNAQNSWTSKADFGGTGRRYAVGFSIGDKVYIGTGYNSGVGHLKDFWEYDPSTNIWTQKADFGGIERRYAVGFSIGDKGYIGTGNRVNTEYRDFWEYDPITNIWTQKADFLGTERQYAVGFSIGDKGYIGLGYDLFGDTKQDFFEYDPNTDAWTSIATFGGTARGGAVGFSIGNKGYVGTGLDINSHKKDFWEYDPSINTWTQKADFGGIERKWAIGFSIGNRGYIGTGCRYEFGCSYYQDFWEYNVVTDTWTQKTDVGGNPRSNAVGFSTCDKGYIGTGRGSSSLSYFNDFMEYTPDFNPFPLVNAGINWSVCMDDSITLGNNPIASGGTAPYTYSWSPSMGLNNPTLANPTASPIDTTSLTYIITITDANSCSSSDSVTVTGVTEITADVGANVAICEGDTITLSVSGGTSFNWIPSTNLSNPNIYNPDAYPDTTTTYYVVVSSGSCIPDTDSVTVTVYPLPLTPVITANGNTLSSSSATGNQWYLNGNPISGATNQYYTVTQSGFYAVEVTDANGCSSKSPDTNITVGIDENQLSKIIKIYPNPTPGKFTLEIVLNEPQTLQLKIFNVLGQDIFTKELNQISGFYRKKLDLSGLSKGVYFLNVRIDDIFINKKLAIK